MKKLVTTVLATAAAATTVMTGSASAATTTSTAACGKPPAAVQGNPMVKPEQSGVAYLYHGSNGFGFRVTHASKAKIVVTGTISASSGISHYRTFKLEHGDAVSESSDGKLMSFRLSNFGGLDGFDFQAECSKDLKVSIKVDGKELPTTRVYLGEKRVHPTSVPFTIERH